VGAGLLEEYATKGHIPVTLLQMKLKSFWLGDFFMTAGQRERYYLLGLLAASKKLSYGKYNQTDPLIHVIPMTPPQEPPILREKVIDKKPEELVLLVAGAFLPWYDYATFFGALKVLNEKKKRNLKVVIMGGNPRDPKFESLVRKMGNLNELQDNIVYTGLVPFKQRANYYLLADAAVNIPSITIEDELSVRTRVIDYIWAGLPIISPAKDECSSTVVNNGAGFAYDAGNPSSLAQTIETIMDYPKKLEQAKNQMQILLQNRFNIKNYISPLESFIENPYVDPSRLSPQGISSDLFLWARDIFNLLKR
jgi:glycosyltransferase involved in cell wall biosynthesis